MTSPNEPPLNQLQFYLTAAYPCSYLQDETAQSLMATPQSLVNANVYNHLIKLGFRRSGDFAYRPNCSHCQACISIRVVLKDFNPNRSQKRAIKQHQHLTTRILPISFNQAHFSLYAAYMKARHAEDVNSKVSQS
ncbi:MAG: arginyltransferase, partial [Methylophilaceae bacterium]